MIPTTLSEWTNCIVNECRINLTKEFAAQRLTVYQDSKHQETQKFVALYGEQHLTNIIQWLKQV